MAAQVCAGDNILWTKLLLLPKFSLSQINQDSSDCANIRIGDDSSRSQSSEPWMLTLNYKLQEVDCRSRLSNN